MVATVPVPKPCSGLMVAAGTLWSPSCEENVIYRIDVKTNKVVAKVPVGPANTEGGIAFGAGSAWMPSDPKGIVSRIDPATNKVTAEIKVAPGSFTAVFGYGLRVGVEHREESDLGHPSGLQQGDPRNSGGPGAAVHGGGRRLRVDAQPGQRDGHEDRSGHDEGGRDDRGRRAGHRRRHRGW